MTTAELTKAAIVRWHEVVNRKDLEAGRLAVFDPVVVKGPQGIGPITRDGFADWIERSGLELRATSWHPISDRVVVVEQDARWPQNKNWTRVATMFRATGDLVSAALRFPDLRSALEFAYSYSVLAATE